MTDMPASTDPDDEPLKLGRLIWPHWPVILLGALATLGTVILSLYLPFITRRVIDGLQAGDAESGWLLTQGATYLGIAIIIACCERGMRFLPIIVGRLVSRELRRKTFFKLLRLDLRFYESEQTGDIMSRMTSDVQAVHDMVGHGLLNLARGSFFLIFGFIVMYRTDAAMANIMAVLMPIMMLIVFVMLYQMRPRYQAAQEQLANISSFAQENFSGIRLVKGFGIESRQEEAFESLNQEYIKRNLSLARIEAPAWPFLGFLFTLGMMLIVYYGGKRVIAGDMTLGTLVLFQQYMLMVTWPFIAVGWTLNLVVKGRISLKRLRHLFDAIPEIRNGALENPASGGDIEFRNIHLELGGRTILEDLSLTIPEGMTIGITGPTGCGKTMLASLLVRQRDPSSGEVLIGDTDIRDLPLDVLRSRIRMSPQEPFMFSDTLADNIAYGEADLDFNRVLWASEVAHLREEAENFPKGFQTELGERGVTLSGGQRQRAAIARAVIGNPEILILDDTLSAVDTQTEAAILKGLRPVLRDRTSIIISHRITSLRDADRTVVMDMGRITQLGSHEELIQTEGYYKDLETTQRLTAQLEAHE